jgi:branched-chain amino acid transport system substrate-binding protein
MNRQHISSRRLVLAAFAASLQAFVPSSHAADNIKIGVIQPLSGPNAAQGNAGLQGIQMVAEEINAAGGIKSMGGAKIQLVTIDVPTVNTAAAATQRLVSQNQVAAVLGAYHSGVTLALSEVTERAGVPLMTFSFGDKITERGYKNIFQVSPKASALGKAQFDDAMAVLKAAGKPTKKVAIIYEDTAYGVPVAQGLRDAATAAGVQVVLNEAYPLGLSDATPLINKLRAAQADLVFPVSSYINDTLQVVRTIRTQGMTMPIVGGSAGYVIPDFQKSLGKFAEGVLSVAITNTDQLPDLSERYKKRTGLFMTHEALVFAATMDTLGKALEKAGSAKPTDVREAIAKINNCDGYAKAMIGGCIKFNSAGLNSAAYPIFVQWRGDALVTVYPTADAKAKAVFND